MDPKRFWDVIAAACHGDGGDGWHGPLVRVLSALPADDVLAFTQRYEAYVAAADFIDLWGAAYLINGGASDDAFYYFRCWLVGMGKEVYEAALADPDSLADVVTDDGFYELSLSGAMREAWQAKTGKSEDAYYRALDKLPSLLPGPVDEGEDWDFDDHDEMRAHFPRLARTYLPDDEG
jgi:hypothetical protein